MRQETSIQTLQLRLRGEYKDLDMMADHYQKVQRKLYATAAKAKKPFSDFKHAFCEKYKLPARLFNALDTALKGMVSSIQEKAKVDLDEVEQRGAGNEAKLAKAEAKQAKLIADEAAGSVIKKLASDIRNRRAKIARCVIKEGYLKSQSISA
jgi:6-phosphogluconate dehydrogenase